MWRVPRSPGSPPTTGNVHDGEDLLHRLAPMVPASSDRMIFEAVIGLMHIEGCGRDGRAVEGGSDGRRLEHTSEHPG